MTDIKVSSDNVIIAVPQPSVPAQITPPKIGLVEINQVIQRGSLWFTGTGFPTTPGGQVGDMYLDVDTGDLYQWNGTEWIFQGTFAPTTLTPAEILAMLITVDGAGSDLDADKLDSHDSTYFATQADMDTQTAKNAAQDATLTNHEGRITTNSNSINTLFTTTGGNTSDIDALEAALATEASTRATNDTTLTNNLAAEVTARTNADTALDAKITTEKNRNDAQDTLIASKIGEAPNDGKQYVRKSLAWSEVSVPPGTIVQDTAPASPAPNQMWMKSSTGVLYIWYADADSSQWIQLSASPQIVDQNYTRKTARTRNRINNPTAQISQEIAPGTPVTTSGGYPADQWMVGIAGIVAAGFRPPSMSPSSPEGSNVAVGFYATTAKGSLASGDSLSIASVIEGADIADLQWGTANAKPVVLRFSAYADTVGTYGFSLRNGGGFNRSYVGSFTITAASTWQTFSFAIPGDTAGTWAKDNTLGLVLTFAGAAGTSNTSATLGWQAGNFVGPNGMTNIAAVINKGFYFTDVGLYADPDNTGLPPPFVAPPYEDDLARCRRYWSKLSAFNNQYGLAAATISQTLTLSSVMRTAPSISFTGGYANGGNVRTVASTAEALIWDFQVTASGTAVFNGAVTMTARMI